jgi:high-affinity nickel-transport protein
VFGGLSVILYRPWRRRVDMKRVRNAHFEPLSQDPNSARVGDEELQASPVTDSAPTKNLDIAIEAVEATDAAGPSHCQRKHVGI